MVVKPVMPALFVLFSQQRVDNIDHIVMLYGILRLHLLTKLATQHISEGSKYASHQKHLST